MNERTRDIYIDDGIYVYEYDYSILCIYVSVVSEC
jgi:hypothetical protein